jgi:hypothetical protein
MDNEQKTKNLRSYTIYPKSLVELDGTNYFLARCDDDGEKVLGVQGNPDGFEGTAHDSTDLLLCPRTPANAAALRKRLSWLKPVPLGLQTSAGCGDRLGLATPGHIRAIRETPGIAPILAQQSMRENDRTGRTVQQVMDEAMWGVFQEGWRDPWGSDADHLKTLDHIDLCVAAGYTFFTIDPGDHVDNEAHTAPMAVLKTKIHALPWDDLADTAEGLHERYLDQRFVVEKFSVTFDELTLARAGSKYGQAIAHTARMYRHLAAQTDNFELEMSVDETETPTSIEEHYFIASELKRLGVQWVSLAPRYIGAFEKGVDYIGDLAVFEADLAKHAAIARVLGPYKLSIHSGSDKFTIYPIIVRLTQGLVHLKTAGTSYLEALRAVAQVDPGLFREILRFARGRYETDRLTYHVSAQLTRVPEPEAVADDNLTDLLDQFDARQVLHVTFGSVSDQFGDQIVMILRNNEETHYQMLYHHFRRHLDPFVAS